MKDTPFAFRAQNIPWKREFLSCPIVQVLQGDLQSMHNIFTLLPPSTSWATTSYNITIFFMSILIQKKIQNIYKKKGWARCLTTKSSSTKKWFKYIKWIMSCPSSSHSFFKSIFTILIINISFLRIRKNLISLTQLLELMQKTNR